MTVDSHPEPDLQRLTRLSYSSAAFFGLWFMVCSPQPIFNVFIANYLAGSPAVLGTLVGLISGAAVFHMLAPVIAPLLRRRKGFWITMTVIHRLNGFLLAWVSFSVAAGADRQQALVVISVGMVVSWILGSIAGPAWWSWMADLLPEQIRSTFFGRRSAVVNLVNVTWFLLVTVAIDLAPAHLIFNVFGVVFLIGGIGGVMDVLMHLPMEEPPQDRVPFDARDLWEPLQHRDFRRFLTGLSVALVAINMVGPFLPPFLTGSGEIGAPAIWLGIQFVLSQLVVVMVAPSWGLMMDRLGRRAIVVMGLLFPLTWTGYFFMTPTNYPVLVPIMAVAAGLLSPAFWEGIQQLNLALAPRRNRISFLSWFWTVFGLSAALGSYAGGVIQEGLAGSAMVAAGWRPLEVVLLGSLVLLVPAALLILRVREPQGRSLGYVMSRIANPGVFRAMVNVNVLASGTAAEQVQRTLRTSEPGSADIATREIVARLDDADPVVRDEAVRALGRLGVVEAAPILWDHAQNPMSTERIAALHALALLPGVISDEEAAARLTTLLAGVPEGSRELRDAVIHALGHLGGPAGQTVLLQLLQETPLEDYRSAAGLLSALTCRGASQVPPGVVTRAYLQLPAVPVGGVRRQIAVALARGVVQSRELEAALREGPVPRSRFVAVQMRRARGRFPATAAASNIIDVARIVAQLPGEQPLVKELSTVICSHPEALVEASALTLLCALDGNRSVHTAE